MKSYSYISYVLLIALLSCQVFAQVSPDWSEHATLPGEFQCEWHNQHEVCLSAENRRNIFKLPDDLFEKAIHKGGQHALYYPVSVTPLQIPYEGLKTFFQEETRSPVKKFFYQIAKKISHFNQFSDIYHWLGLHDYPASEEEYGPNPIPSMGSIQNDPMGATVYQGESRGITFSCAACHSGDLFGTKVLGLTNRFPRANEFFILGKKVLSKTPDILYQAMFNADHAQMKIFSRSKEAIKHVGLKAPQALGLDTSLAQVGLSLSKRKEDAYASKDIRIARHPRPNQLNLDPADSKPAVWWNLKYKTRWLSDGSIVSGNPIHTNFLWNEIGRGVDLKELEKWLLDNQKKIDDLTSYVFAAKAPRYNDFFPNQIRIEMAKKGERLFLKNCSSCHGKYEKGWDDPSKNYIEQLATTKVLYHQQTPVIDVGTDSYRYKGMRHFAKDLNRLQISRTIGAKVVPQKGYVPPPLVGIWARWPYFHNNSVPTLYDVITPDYNRPKTYIAVASLDRNKDFDQVKNGYPKKELIRKEYRTNPDYFFDTTKKGLSNKGHTKMLLNQQGEEKLSFEEKMQLIEFLKTL